MDLVSSFGLASAWFFLLAWLHESQYEYIGSFLDGSQFFSTLSTQERKQKPRQAV